MPENKDISVVIPLFNEEESIEELCNWISRVMNDHGFSYEVIVGRRKDNYIRGF